MRRLAAAEAALRGGGPARPAAGLRRGDLPAALLCAMLRAAGERASVDYTREAAVLRVGIAFADVRTLPPWARVVRSPAGRLEVLLAPDGRWRPAGYLPPDVRGALQRRRVPAVLAALAS